MAVDKGMDGALRIGWPVGVEIGTATTALGVASSFMKGSISEVGGVGDGDLRFVMDGFDTRDVVSSQKSLDWWFAGDCVMGCRTRVGKGGN